MIFPKCTHPAPRKFFRILMLPPLGSFFSQMSSTLTHTPTLGSFFFSKCTRHPLGSEIVDILIRILDKTPPAELKKDELFHPSGSE